MTTITGVDKTKDGYPWRRFFARSIDHALYVIPWSIIAYFVLHIDISAWNIRNMIISYVLMLLIEPFFLRIFGTTLGKAIFGIRIKNEQGENLTLAQGYRRIWGVFGLGFGYGIPIYSFYRHYRCFKECKESNNIMEWDFQNKFSYSINLKILPLRGIICLLCIIMLGGILFMLPFAADMPKHRGGLSSEQFLENVERYARFHRLGDEALTNAWMWATPPELTIIETNGVVTGIKFEIVDGSLSDIRGLEHWVRAYVVSFVGAQEGVNFWNLHIARGNPIREFFPYFWFQWPHFSNSHTAFGVEMIYEIDADWDAFIVPVDVRFSMRKIDI